MALKFRENYTHMNATLKEWGASGYISLADHSSGI